MNDHHLIWKPSDEREIAYYDKLFKVVDRDNAGGMGGQEAVRFFSLSGLPIDQLKCVWSVAYASGETLLNRSEFYVAMRVVALAQSGESTLTRERIQETAADEIPMPTLRGAPRPPIESSQGIRLPPQPLRAQFSEEDTSSFDSATAKESSLTQSEDAGDEGRSIESPSSSEAPPVADTPDEDEAKAPVRDTKIIASQEALPCQHQVQSSMTSERLAVSPNSAPKGEKGISVGDGTRKGEKKLYVRIDNEDHGGRNHAQDRKNRSRNINNAMFKRVLPYRMELKSRWGTAGLFGKFGVERDTFARPWRRLRPTEYAPRPGNAKQDSDRARQGDGGIEVNPGRGYHPVPQSMGPKASSRILEALLPCSRRARKEVADGTKGINVNIKINAGGNDMMDTEGHESTGRSQQRGDFERSLGESDQKVGIQVKVPRKGNRDEPAVDDAGGLPRRRMKSRTKRIVTSAASRRQEGDSDSLGESVESYSIYTEIPAQKEVGSKSKLDTQDPWFPPGNPDKTDDSLIDLGDPLPYLLAHPEPESLSKPQELSVSYPSGIRRSSALTTSLELRLAPRFPRKHGEETDPDAIREARVGTPRDSGYADGGTERNPLLIRCRLCAETLPELCLDQHVRSTCRLVPCPLCPRLILPVDRERHIKEACRNRRESCSRCGEAVSLAHFSVHDSSGICGRGVLSCTLCGAFLLANELAEHKVERCPEREVQCESCGDTIRAKELGRHSSMLCRKLEWTCRCGRGPMPLSGRTEHLKQCEAFLDEWQFAIKKVMTTSRLEDPKLALIALAECSGSTTLAARRLSQERAYLEEIQVAAAVVNMDHVLNSLQEAMKRAWRVYSSVAHEGLAC